MSYKKIFAIVAFGFLASCSSNVLNGANQALSVQEEHPISVEQQTVTLTIVSDPSLSEITQLDKARLKAFLSVYFSRGEGPITITAPSGGSNDFVGQELAADIRTVLNKSGVEWSSILGATYRLSGSAEMPEVILTFGNYVASATKCGDYSEEYSRRSRNLRSKNFGCASQQNFAVLLANPRDLIEPEAMVPADMGRQGIVFDAYRAGEVTSSAEDQATDVSASGQ